MTEPQKKVLIITSEFPPNVGGIGNHAYNLAKSLSHYYEVSVIADSIDVEEEHLQSFRANESIKITYIKREKLVVKTYLQRLYHAYKASSKVDVIICSGKFPLWLGMVIRQFNPKKKMIAVVHGSELDLKSKPAKKLTNRAIKSFNKIISVSNYTEQFLPVLKSNIHKVVIPNGINLQEFRTITEVTHLKGAPSLITIGSVTERKGQHNVINALPVILQKYPLAHYHIVGKPVQQLHLETLAGTLGVKNHITFHGAVSRHQLLLKLASAKIKLMLSVHTSEGEFEGFGIAVLEANALGIPVVGSKNSGIADAIDDGMTGILVDPLNVDEVAAAIETINKNYTLFSSNARHWAAKHDWKNVVERYIEVINN